MVGNFFTIRLSSSFCLPMIYCILLVSCRDLMPTSPLVLCASRFYAHPVHKNGWHVRLPLHIKPPITYMAI